MNTSQTYPRRRASSAFTLIEVLLASTVMVLLVGIVAYIAGSVLNTWNRSSGKLTANAEARLALDMITQDLQTAVLRNNGQQWLRVEGPDFLSGSSYASNSVALKLFAPAMDRQSGDGICAIAYKLAYKESYNGGLDTYALYRRVTNPDDTLNNYLSSGFTDNASSTQGSLDSANLLWSDASITDVANYLATNIVEFKVLIYDSSQELPRNADGDYVVLSDYVFGGSDSTAGNAPLYADIILTVVTDQGMELLRNISAATGAALAATNDEGAAAAISLASAGDADEVVAQHGETFIRRVHFKSNPL